MGSFIEINDTLQLTPEQGFPLELDYKKHLDNPFLTEDFKDRVFEFHNKPAIRIYKLPPVRNFFAQNIDGKWIYWGLVHVIEITHDNINMTTSGKYKIIQIFSPEEMKNAHIYLHPSKGNSFFQ